MIKLLGDLRNRDKTRPNVRPVDKKQQEEQKTILSESPACMTEGWLLQTSLHNWINAVKKRLNIHCLEKTLWNWPIWQNYWGNHRWDCKTMSKGVVYPALCLWTTRNIIKDNEPTKHFSYRNISLILFSKRAQSLLLVERLMERHILRERTSFHIFFREPGGANACIPLQAVSSERSLIGCVSLARLPILCTSV